jgi:acyl-CoA dehydrogenase
MDFELPEELRILQATVRKFVETEVLPHEKEMPEENDIPPDLRKNLEDRCKAMGLWLLDVPEEYGGAALPLLARCVVLEEIFRVSSWRIGDILGPEVRILINCSEGQKEKYFYPVIRGEKETCFALTEPEAGTDAAAIRTTAAKDGDCYVLNGMKRFITDADRASFSQVFAVTDREKGARGGITCFLVDMDLPGVSLGRREETMVGDIWEIILEEARIPESAILGKVGKGFVVAQSWLTIGRLRQALRGLGAAQRSLEMTTSYAKQRVTFGEPLSERQAVQWMLADSAIELHAARLMVWDCAWKYDQGRDVRQETAMAKVYAVEMALRVVDRAIQIHGGLGLTKELPFQWWFREMRRYRVTEANVEIMRWLIARQLLRK